MDRCDKFCVNCKHFAAIVWCYSGIDGNFPNGSESSLTAGCYKGMPESKVTGKRQFVYAGTMRSDTRKCGPDGTWFEKKAA